VKINIIGAGAWGTTLGILLDKKGCDVSIWQRDSNKSDNLSTTRLHPNLKKINISNNIHFTSKLKELDFENLTVLAIPSHAIDNVLSYCDSTKGKYLIVSKGFDQNSTKLISEILVDNHNINLNNIAVLSGPNHAEEIILNMASATVVASGNQKYSKELQTLFSSDTFRVYSSKDIIGVQVGGAVKNVIAIASGLCVGLKLGDNTQAALVSRGMNEILNLSTIYNLDSKTLYGLSGFGDLIATCYSPHSRNRQLGILLAKGKSLDESKSEIGMVSEGINTTKILNKISYKHNIEMPICNEVNKILFNNSDPKESLYKLMTRNLKDEN